MENQDNNLPRYGGATGLAQIARKAGVTIARLNVGGGFPNHPVIVFCLFVHLAFLLDQFIQSLLNCISQRFSICFSQAPGEAPGHYP